MLDDHERRRLAEIETWLRADDPGFVREFNVRERVRGQRLRVAFLALPTVILIVAIVVGLMMGAPPVAIVVGLAAGTAVGMSATRRRQP
jgi:hypothetical protein